MDEQEYVSLLQRARSQLPQKILTRERFVMPTIESIIEGSKTYIVNWQDILKALNADEQRKDHLSKYLARENATSAVEEGNRLVLQGRFAEPQLNKVLSTYIKHYVLCPICEKPDTHLIKEERLTIKVCEACGARQSV